MTLTATTNKVQYNGDGATTAFAVTFIYWDDTDVTVIHRDSSGTETTWVSGTQYTLTGGDGATGTLNVETSPTDYTPASGETLTIKSSVPQTQETSLPAGGSFPSDSVEERLDKLTRLIQQLQEEIDRSIVLPATTSLSDIELPEPGADEIIKWNAGGTALETKSATEIGTAVGVDETDTDTVETKLVSNLLMNHAIGREGTALASAATVNLASATYDYVHITGTTTITGFGSADVAGRRMLVVFDGALTLTHHATNLILPGGSNITTTAGDCAILRAEDNAGAWRCISYIRAADSVALGQQGQNVEADSSGNKTWDIPSHLCEGRLTLTSGTPVTSSDVTGAGTVYFAPYNGERIAIYDGTNWKSYRFSELSIALSGGTASKPHDVFIYDNAGTLTLELVAWTDDTNRATALATQDGVYVKSGATSRRYLGSLYIDGSNQCDDSLAKRNLYNYSNRVRKAMAVQESTNTWTYTTASFRQANNSSANQLEFMRGVAEGAVSATVAAVAANTNTGVNITSGIGVDSTTVNSAQMTPSSNIFLANGKSPIFAYYRSDSLAAGRHTLTWLEYSQAIGTTTWHGDNGGSFNMQTGIFGEVYV